MKQVPACCSCLLVSPPTPPPRPAGAAPRRAEPAPTSALDGEWRGTSDGGSCNAPLDYVLTIENGFVDGSASDTTAHGPVPNTQEGPPPAPTPGLWQIHGVAKHRHLLADRASPR